MKKALFLPFLFSVFGLQAQIPPTLDNTAPNDGINHLVENVLIDVASTGLVVSNVTLTSGTSADVGYFTGGTDYYSIESGIYLSTNGQDVINGGFGNGGSGGSATTDGNLIDQLSLVGINGEPVNNITIIEFDFIAEGTSVEFEYVFGSAEYQLWTCSQYNDIFGFFISGPGIDGDVDGNGTPDLGYNNIDGTPYEVYNMAKIPDPNIPNTFTNTPVIINALNSGTSSSGDNTNCDNIDPNWQDYSIFFVQNYTPNLPFPNTSFRGWTTPLKAVSEVVCGEKYHMKLAVADVSDGSVNSGVFLKEGSFGVVSGSTTQGSDFALSDSILIEGCYPGIVTVELDQYSEVADAEILVSVTGTAEEGVDFLDIQNLLVIPAGDSVGTIEVQTLVDNLDEVNESIIVSTYVCDDIISSDTFFVTDPQLISLQIPEDTTICANATEPVVLTANPTGGYEPYSFSWYYNGNIEGFGIQFGVPPYAVGEHVCVLTGDCGYQSYDTFTLNHFPPVPEATIESDFSLDTNQIVEGCEYAELTFTLPFAYAVDTILPFQIVGGDAEEGVDFYDLPRTITVPAGELSASINVEAIVDGIFEDDETIQFYFPFYDECTTFPNPITVTILSNPEISSHLDDSMLVCQGETFELDAQIIGGIEPYVFSWTQKPAGEWTTESIEQIAEDTTMYYLSVRDACEYEVLDSIVVVVPHYPEMKISSVYSSEISMCREDVLDLKPVVTGGTGKYAYEWHIDGLPFSNDSTITIQSDELAVNDYTLYVIDSCGNAVERTFQVKVEHCEVPNVFTPNGDGLNDEFYFNSKDVEGNIRVKIHDRWGKLIFESSNYELCNDGGIKCWDGTDGNEKEHPEGVYFYTIEYIDGRLLKGTFHLLR